MGLFGPFRYKNKKGDTYYLHKETTGNRTLYYFSKEPAGSMFSKPSGYKIVENPKTGMPYLKKGQGGLLGKIMEFLGMSTDAKKEEEPE